VNTDGSVDLLMEEHTEARVVRICSRTLLNQDLLDQLRDSLLRFAESGNGRLILDFAAVEYISSACIGLLVTLRKRLRQRGRAFQPPFRWRDLLAVFPGADDALEAIRQGGRDPLLLCGVRREIIEIIQVC